ncbi:unnamed protein product [Caenorhabditis bovis]|uniref:C6 domain-containing protein n=1 Tax=Caenorhabditis bovis TaxID=2654633 RepID=A0A8S1FC01_9PELO|nr:unnamed protein product [Caenorhabditis bovis]
MFRLFVIVCMILAAVNAGCPSPSSIYLPAKVKCPSCDFTPSSGAFQGSGNKYTIKCPANTDVWFYNESGKEFVAPMSAVGSKGSLSCEGSKWRLRIPGQSQIVSAFACASS